MDEKQIQDIFMQDIEKYPVLSEEEQESLLKEYKMDGSKEAYQKLVSHNLGLAVMVANRYISRCKSMSFLDLIQENCLILMKAIEKYDINNKESKFSTYATKAMQKTLQRSIDEKDELIKLSYRTRIYQRKCDQYIGKCLQNDGKKPTKAEIKNAVNMSNRRMKLVEEGAICQTLSLEKTISNNSYDKEEITLHDMIASSQNGYSDYDKFQDTLVLLRSLKDFLTEEEYYTFYYREISKNPKTLKQVGDELGVKEETIRIRQKRILEKLKPVIHKIQATTIATYGLNGIDTSEFVPLEPKKRLALHYLKQNIDTLPYHMIYTKLCDRINDNYAHYQSKFPEETENIVKVEQQIPNFMQQFFTSSIIDKIYEEEGSGLKIADLLELNIKPEGNNDRKDYQENSSLAKLIEKVRK